MPFWGLPEWNFAEVFVIAKLEVRMLLYGTVCMVLCLAVLVEL